MAAREVEVLSEVCGFDMDGGVKMTMTQAHINIQKHELGEEGVQSELDELSSICNLFLVYKL